MIPSLSRYLDRLHATIHSRQEITVEEFELFDRSAKTGRTSALCMRLCFWDGSLLQVDEALKVQGLALIKTRYNYHYQSEDGSLLFRYDNAPHYPDLPGFPEHKHEGEQVVPTSAPDLSQVLKEIDSLLYPGAAPGQAEVVTDRPT